ncbi:MAG: WD40-repeat-containing domain protein [Benniella sp.]|nr:MAG: WD40-repeat-containing domain protein [Benniella sp.]
MYSPRGYQLALSNSDYAVETWSILTGDREHILHGHNNEVTDVAYSPQGEQIASASKDTTVKLWDVETGDCLHTLNGHGSIVRCIAYSPKGDQVAFGSDDSTVRLWDVMTGECSRIFAENHISARDLGYSRIVYSPQGDHVASIRYDMEVHGYMYTIRLWNTATGGCQFTWLAENNNYNFAAYSPRGDQIASSKESKVLLWDVETGNLLHTLAGHSYNVYKIVYSPQGDLIASVCRATVRLWDAATGVCLRILTGYTYGIQSVAFSPNGDQIISGDIARDTTVRICDVGVRTSQRTSSSHDREIRMVKCSPKGDQVASCSNDMTVRLWNVATGSCRHTLRGHSDVVSCIAYSPQGDQIATGSKDTTVRLWDAETGRCTHTLTSHSDAVIRIVYSPQRNQLFSFYRSTVLLWNVRTGKRRQLWASKGHEDWIASIVYSSHGDLVVSTSEDQTVRLWDTVSGQCLAVIQDFLDRVNDIAWVETPNAQYVVAGCEDGVVGMWQVIVDEDRCQVHLHWKTTTGVFDVRGATIQDVQGLSPHNKRILGLSGAVGEPARRQSTMAPVITQFNDSSDRSEEDFVDLINIPAKRLFELDEEDEGVAKRTRGNAGVSRMEE